MRALFRLPWSYKHCTKKYLESLEKGSIHKKAWRMGVKWAYEKKPSEPQANRCRIVTKSNHFRSGWVLAIKSAALITVSNHIVVDGKWAGANLKIGQDWRSESFCCVFDGICKESTSHELLSYDQNLNSDLYFEQSHFPKDAIAQRCPALTNKRGIVFHQANARPYTSIATRQQRRRLNLGNLGGSYVSTLFSEPRTKWLRTLPIFINWYCW